MSGRKSLRCVAMLRAQRFKASGFGFSRLAQFSRQGVAWLTLFGGAIMLSAGSQPSDVEAS